MTFAGLFKKPNGRLTVFSAVCFFAPYLVPLFQNGAAALRGELAAKLLFVFAATALVVQIASHIKPRGVRIAAATSLWAALELLILFEAFMFCFTGHSFDRSFLLHFNVEAVSGEVMRVFWMPVSGALLFCSAAVAAAGMLIWKAEYRRERLRGVPVMLFSLVFFFVPGTPGAILSGVIADNVRASYRDRSSVDWRKIHASPGKNLVFIVVESLEQNLLNEKHFPGLLPNISKWADSDEALVFENMTSVACNTFEFLYQSHMGDYMYSITDGDCADRQLSLSRLLKRAGYNTVFFQACNLDFASTGTFVKNVSYDQAWDCRTPKIKEQTTELGAWGFRDYELFEIARKEFGELAARDKPFAFTIFTVDSHAPFGVIGRRSLDYTAPDGGERPLLSAYHTTDAALGRFLEFIKNHPKGKDTVIVISGDHLLMKGLASGHRTVQSLLEYKARKNLLTFIINGRERGKFAPRCWPVDLAPVILYQMGVEHNAKFPCGVNCLTERDAAPRVFDYEKYIARQKSGENRNAETENVLAETVSLSGDAAGLSMRVGKRDVKCDPLEEFAGTVMEFNSVSGRPTINKDYLQRDYVDIFRTHPRDRNLFYLLCACGKTLFHFLLGERDTETCFLAAVIGGWYKAACAPRLADLRLSGLDEPLPRVADAAIDVSKNIVTLKKGGWTFPLFSKNDTYIPRCVVAAVADAEGNETLTRMRFHIGREMKELDALMNSKKKLTVIAPPDSPLHRKCRVPEDKIDRILRLRVTPEGRRVELFPMRLPGEGYIGRTGKGRYCYFEQDRKTAVPLTGAAPEADFGNGLCCAVTFDAAGKRPVAFESFRESRVAVGLMANQAKRPKTLLICGKNSEFLKTYYPRLAGHNVLFAVTPSAIRHAAQYGNGNFRIPAAAEPLNTQGAAGVHLADNILIVSWGNASFVLPEATLDSWFAAGNELALKLLHHDPAGIVFFDVNDPAWVPDILKAYKTDFLILGNEKSRIPELLSRRRMGKYFLGVSRGLGWELFWNDRIDFSVASYLSEEHKPSVIGGDRSEVRSFSNSWF